MLRFDTDKFDFWMVYETRKRFYPIGIEKDESGVYDSYPGIMELQALIINQLHDEQIFRDQWVSFELLLQAKASKQVIGTTYGQAPCFSSFLLLDEKRMDNLTRTKKLFLFVSLLGPYYSVIGEDANMVIIEKKWNYQSTSYLVASPKNEFAKAFELVTESIENRFPDYRFIPFGICNQQIEGLSVTHTDLRPATVFNALFNNELNLSASSIIGDEFHKSGDWLKAGYIDKNDGWTAYAPTPE